MDHCTILTAFEQALEGIQVQAPFGLGRTDFACLSGGISQIFSGIPLNPGLPGVTRYNDFGARFGAH